MIRCNIDVKAGLVNGAIGTLLAVLPSTAHLPGVKCVLNFRRESVLIYHFITSLLHMTVFVLRLVHQACDKQKSRRLLRGEQINTAFLASGRATLPVRGTLTVRPRFHKHPFDIPPPSDIPAHVTEHTY